MSGSIVDGRRCPRQSCWARDGQVSELTVIAPLKEGGGARLRKIFVRRAAGLPPPIRSALYTICASSFWTTITKLLFASTYDGDWETYINDFATLIPDALDMAFSEVQGWPGSARHNEGLHRQVSDHCFRMVCRFSEAAVPSIRRGLKIAAAVDGLLTPRVDTIRPLSPDNKGKRWGRADGV